MEVTITDVWNLGFYGLMFIALTSLLRPKFWRLFARNLEVIGAQTQEGRRVQQAQRAGSAATIDRTPHLV